MLYNGNGRVNQMFYAHDFKNNNLVLRHNPLHVHQHDAYQTQQHLLPSSFAPITTSSAINNAMSPPTFTRSKLGKDPSAINNAVNPVRGQIHLNTVAPYTNSVSKLLPQQPWQLNQMMNQIHARAHSCKSPLGALQQSISMKSPQSSQHPKLNVPAVFPVLNNILSPNLSDFENLISPETACNIDNGDWTKVPETRGVALSPMRCNIQRTMASGFAPIATS